MKKITAIDAPDRRVPAVQPGRRLPAEGRVQRVRHPGLRLPRRPTCRTARSSTTPNGTGPYKFKEWSKGNRIVWEANPRLLGRQGQDAEPRAPLERRVGRTPASTCSPAPSTASTTPAPRTSRRSRATRTCSSTRAPGLNTLFLGFNNTQKPFDDVRVRQAIAMGIDRDQIVKNFYPDGSTVADYFTPCEIPFACEGDKTWTLRPGRGQDAPRRGRLPGRPGPQRRHQLPRSGPRLQPEPAGHRDRDRPAAQEEPRHHRDAEAARVGRHDRRLHARARSRVSA